MLETILVWVLFLLPFVVAFAVGLLLIPGAVYGFGSGYPRLFAGVTLRMLWTVGMFCYGAALIYEREGNLYELLAADIEDGNLVVDVDGERTEIDGGRAAMGRLGKRPIGFAPEKSAKQMDDFEAIRGPLESDNIFKQKRQGIGFFNPFADRDAWLVPLRQKVDALKDSAGTAIIDNAEDEALVEFGGQNQLSPLATLIGMFFAFLFGGGMTVLAMMATGA